MRAGDRIQARAVRRCGELLKTYDGRGGDRTKKVDTRPSAKDMANDAGMSEHQHKTAARVANVPDEQFDEAVELDKPPAVTTPVRDGQKKAPPAGTDGADGIQVQDL